MQGRVSHIFRMDYAKAVQHYNKAYEQGLQEVYNFRGKALQGM